MDQWHIARGKVKKGPYSFSQLQKAAAKGSIHATDQVLQPGAQEWVAARQVSGLFPAPPAKPADAIPAEIPVATGAKPVSPIAAVGISEEETAISPPKKSDWLQTTRGLLGRFGGKPEANPELHGAAGRRSRVWLGVAGAGIGLCLLVVVSFVIFGGKSGAVVGDKSGPGVGSKSGPSQTVDSPASGSPDVELPPKTVAAPAIKPPQLELPPVGPTKPPARDVVMQEFKAARAEYRAALTKARDDLRAQYPSIKAQIEKSNLDPREKATSLKRLLDEQGKFTQVESSGGGPIHTHPAMQPAVAEYVQARKSAARKFGEVADKGLIAYEKAGVTDEAKLRPLQAARLVGEHPDLIGIWEGTPGQGQRPMFVTQTVQEVWHIGVDEHTGGWLISGYEAQYGFAPRAAYLGEHIEFKDGVLTFNALPVDEEHTKPRQLFPTAPPAQGGAPGFGNAPGLGGRAAPKSAPPPSRVRKEAAKAKPAVNAAGNVVKLKLRDGEIHCETKGRPELAGLVLHRTDEERHHYYFDRYEKKAIARPTDAPAEVADLNDANYVWRRVAQLASFAYYRSRDWSPLEHEALYLPYRRDHLTPSEDGSGGLLDMMTASAPGARKNQSRGEALLRAYESLSAAPHPYLKRMTDQAAAICRSRLQLAMADDQFGNTVGSSIREFQQTVLIPGVQVAMLELADEARVRDSLQREYPQYHIIVTDAPMSEETKAKWGELMKGAGNIKKDIEQRGVVSGMLAYADMAQVDHAVAFWQTWLLPLAKRCGGPVADKPLVNVEGAWAPKKNFQRLSLFYVKNASGQDLTHVVMELIAENEWGEKAAHYCHFDQLEVGDFVSIVPHFRWEKRRLDFMNTINVTWSLWADQASEVGRKVKLTSPTPNPDPAGWRKDYLSYDQQYQAEGEAVGALMKTMVSLPSISERQRRLLQEAAAPKKSYAFSLPGEAKRTLLLRFLRFDSDTFEAEVVDLRTRKPFDPQTAVWKGKIVVRQEAAIMFGKEADATEASWAFALFRDDQPMIICPGADKPGAVFPARNLTVFAVEGP